MQETEATRVQVPVLFVHGQVHPSYVPGGGGIVVKVQEVACSGCLGCLTGLSPVSLVSPKSLSRMWCQARVFLSVNTKHQFSVGSTLGNLGISKRKDTCFSQLSPPAGKKTGQAALIR